MKDLPSLTPKPGKALPTSRLPPGAVSTYREFISKMARGVNLSYRKVLETSEGPLTPVDTELVHGMQPGTDLSQEIGVSQSQSFHHPSGHNQQTRGPGLREPFRAMQTTAWAPQPNHHHPYHWEKAGHWEPYATLFPSPTHLSFHTSSSAQPGRCCLR